MNVFYFDLAAFKENTCKLIIEKIHNKTQGLDNNVIMDIFMLTSTVSSARILPVCVLHPFVSH